MGINAFVALTMSQGGSKSKQALAASFVAGVLLVVEVRMHTPYQPTTDRLPAFRVCMHLFVTVCQERICSDHAHAIPLLIHGNQ
jgi:hypothetical protein